MQNSTRIPSSLYLLLETLGGPNLFYSPDFIALNATIMMSTGGISLKRLRLY